MRNAETTRNLIIQKSADLFNTQGYKATSLSDITKATGFTKGAIYRHFESKQDLEQQALQQLSFLMFQEIGKKIKEADTFQTKFEAIFSFFENYMNTPLYKGGCPLLNVAVEADDANPLLRHQASLMLTQLKTAVQKLILNGIKNGQVQPETDAALYSTVIIATLEGGIMMSKLEGTKTAILHTIEHLRDVTKKLSL